MASGSQDHDIDIEAQHVPSRPPQVSTIEMHQISILQPDANSDGDDGQPAIIDQSTHIDAQPVVTRAEIGIEERELVETDVLQSGCHDGNIPTTTQSERGEIHTETIAHNVRDTNTDPAAVLNNLSVPADSGGSPDSKTRMIGDFDGSANPLWSLYGKEAKSQDESRIQTLKGDMDGVLIFAGLFSASLTAFIIDSKQALKPNPSDQMVYYLQQNGALLSQISQQISFVVPQLQIPSTPPSPFPSFSPSATDVRVNVFWFMALVFALSAALMATLVQQWVRDYMHVFQRYTDPLKSARIRQYLHEGSEGWYMPVVAEAVPGVLHVSLFLFFIGLADFVLTINTKIGISTTISIGICGLLYIFTMIAPVLYPQSPYQNSFSGLIWYAIQTFRGRRYRNRDGEVRSVSGNMTQGQMQLAMEETDGRMKRDARAIQWLVGNQTEDGEWESFAMTIPGSFNAEWGTKVWKHVAELTEDEHKGTSGNDFDTCPLMDANLLTDNALPPVDHLTRVNVVRRVFGSILRPLRTITRDDSVIDDTVPLPLQPLNASPSPVIGSSQGGSVVRDLSAHISHLLETCKNRGAFASDEQWRRRTRGCVQATASLVFSADAKLEWFGDIGQLLRDIGKAEKTRESSSLGIDQSFVTQWTCLSLLATRSMLNGNLPLHLAARKTSSYFDSVSGNADPNTGTDKPQGQLFDYLLSTLWNSIVVIHMQLFFDATRTITEGRVKEVLDDNQRPMDTLRMDYMHSPTFRGSDHWILAPQNAVQVATHNLICELPGVEFDVGLPDPLPFSLAAQLITNPSYQLLCPGRLYEGLSSIFPGLQRILEGQNSDPEEFKEVLKDLGSVQVEQFLQTDKNWVQLQQWRCQDLHSGGGLGFTVETFFIALRQLLSISTSSKFQSPLYIKTFRAITSDWREYKDSLGTQKILLHLIASNGGLMSRFDCPENLREELLTFVDNMFKGQTGPHIDHAIEWLQAEPWAAEYAYHYHGNPDFPARVLRVLESRQSAPPS